MRPPRELVDEIESGAGLPAGDDERFFGYSVIGLPFVSGHILALRRFAASSIGPAYASVWHRSPEGDWTFYQNVLPQQACSRYFGKLIRENILTDIAIDWTGPCGFTVRIEGDQGLTWTVTVRSSVATVLMNAVGALIPRSWWQRPAVLSLMGGVARVGLRTGPMRLVGHAPNGQTFVANPRRIWMVSGSRAVVRGRETGRMGPLAEQGRLGEFIIPQRGIFAIGSAYLETFDSARHLSMTSVTDTH